MAAGWVTVLQMVPWGEVIKNAPKVADGAVKLWNSVSKKRVDGETDSDVTDVMLATDMAAVEKLEHRLHSAEQTITDLPSSSARHEVNSRWEARRTGFSINLAIFSTRSGSPGTIASVAPFKSFLARPRWKTSG